MLQVAFSKSYFITINNKNNNTILTVYSNEKVKMHNI